MADAKYDVLGIGNAIFDILVKTDEAFLQSHGMHSLLARGFGMSAPLSLASFSS